MTIPRSIGLAILLVIAVGGVSAKADIVFTLTSDHCTGGCYQGTGSPNFGTVTLSQEATGVVEVSVALLPGYQFYKSGLGATFGFNLTGNPTITATDYTPTTFTLQSGTAGSIHIDGFGNFGYGIDCTTCGMGVGGGTSLSLDVNATNLTPSSFTTSSSGSPNAYFAIDIISTGVNGTKTGPIDASAADVVTTPVPEPFSILLLGTLLLPLASKFKRLVGGVQGVEVPYCTRTPD